MVCRSKRSVRSTNSSEKNRLPFHRSLAVVVILIATYGVGFALVISISRPAEDTEEAVSAPEAELPAVQKKSENHRRRDVSMPVEVPLTKRGNGASAVPPGKEPEGVSVTEKPLYFVCWDAEGAREVGRSCDALGVLEKRFHNRLYLVDECKRSVLGKEEEGTLCLGVQVDFAKEEILFWSAPSSNLKEAKTIGRCIRQALAGLPLHGIAHKFERYRIFFTVEFKDPKKLSWKSADLQPPRPEHGHGARKEPGRAYLYITGREHATI